MTYKVEEDIEKAIAGDMGARLRVEVAGPFIEFLRSTKPSATYHDEIMNLIASLYILWIRAQGIKDPALFEASQTIISRTVEGLSLRGFKKAIGQ